MFYSSRHVKMGWGLHMWFRSALEHGALYGIVEYWTWSICTFSANRGFESIPKDVTCE